MVLITKITLQIKEKFERLRVYFYEKIGSTQLCNTVSTIFVIQSNNGTVCVLVSGTSALFGLLVPRIVEILVKNDL